MPRPRWVLPEGTSQHPRAHPCRAPRNLHECCVWTGRVSCEGGRHTPCWRWPCPRARGAGSVPGCAAGLLALPLPGSGLSVSQVERRVRRFEPCQGHAGVTHCSCRLSPAVLCSLPRPLCARSSPGRLPGRAGPGRVSRGRGGQRARWRGQGASGGSGTVKGDEQARACVGEGRARGWGPRGRGPLGEEPGSDGAVVGSREL